MNKHEENKLTMYKGVLTVMESNSPVYSAFPILTEAVNDLKTCITNIDAFDKDMRRMTVGSTAQKVVNEEELVNAALKVANILFIYATRNGLEELKQDTKTTRSALDILRDTELANRARVYFDKAEELIAELTGYGITQEFIDAAKLTLSLFEESFNHQQEKYAERSMNRMKLTELFSDADDILNEQLDSFMEMFIDTNTDFYNEYKSARAIRDLGHRSAAETPEEVTPES